MTQFSREFGEVILGQHHPRRPLPVPSRASHADIQDQPMQPSRPDVGRAEFMKLPWARDGEMSGPQPRFFWSAVKAIEPVSRKVISTPRCDAGLHP